MELVPGDVADPLVRAGEAAVEPGDCDGVQHVLDGLEAKTAMRRAGVEEGTDGSGGKSQALLQHLPQDGVGFGCPGPVDGGGSQVVSDPRDHKQVEGIYLLPVCEGCV